MKKPIILTALITGLFLMNLSCARASAQKEQPSTDGTAALFRSIGMMYLGAQDIPDFEVTSLDNRTITLSSLKGKIVFLNFWATWCPPCQAEMPSIQRLYEQFKDTDFTILAVSVGEDAKTVEDFLNRTPYSFHIALNEDARLGSMYAGRGIPSTYILNREGKIIAAKIGAQDWDTEEIAGVIKKLLENGI